MALISFYSVLFTGLVMTAVTIETSFSSSQSHELDARSPAFRSFRNNYLFVYSMAMGRSMIYEMFA